MNDSITQHPQPETKLIPLTQNKFAIVDAADYAWLSQWKWYIRKHGCTFYAVRTITKPNGKRSTLSMHQLICGKGADHINGDGLNNTGNNLRSATHQQNTFNRAANSNSTSQFKGVCWDKTNKKWLAQIMLDGKTKHLGHFDDPEEAARAYDQAARELFGEFARLNFEVAN